MVEIAGKFKPTKSAIFKINDSINIQNLASHTLKMVLLKSNAIVDRYTIDTFTGDITNYEQDYSGYARQTLTNISRVDSIQDRYVWIADDVEFKSLNASVRYGLIIDENNNILSVMDLEDVYTFAGDITFDLNVHGFFGIKA